MVACCFRGRQGAATSLTTSASWRTTSGATCCCLYRRPRLSTGPICKVPPLLSANLPKVIDCGVAPVRFQVL